MEVDVFLLIENYEEEYVTSFKDWGKKVSLAKFFQCKQVPVQPVED